MKRIGGMKHNMLKLVITDENTLYNSYLPFLKQGGLFVPTDKTYHLGDNVFLLLTLMNDSDKIPISGKVAWINPKGTQGNRPPGIGVDFGDMDKGVTREKVEKFLTSRLKSDKATYTM